MDTFGKSVPLFFLIILLLCVETLGRESRFFNRVSRESKDVQQAKEEEEEPSFVSQTTENSPYGLYGHGTDPSTTTTEKLKYETQKEQPGYFEEAIPATTTAEPEYSNYFHRKNYATQLQGVDGYSKAYFNNNNNRNKGNGKYYYNGERQGMSDTRFMENGKYYYDVNSGPYYNYGAYQNNNGGRRPEYYNNEGYYSGSTQSFNDNRGQQTLQEQDFDFDP